VSSGNNQHVLTAEEVFQLVSENVGIAFLTKAGAIRAKIPSITVRPLVDKELRIELYLASRAENRSKLVSEFVRAFMKRIKQVLAPPQMILPLSDIPLIPNETIAAKHKPRSERGTGRKADARQVLENLNLDVFGSPSIRNTRSSRKHVAQKTIERASRHKCRRICSSVFRLNRVESST
jgi:hypothetical protein